jgi:hypothetical protein
VGIAERCRQVEDVVRQHDMVPDARTYSAATFIIQTQDILRAAISSNCCKAKSKSFSNPRQLLE